MEGALDVPHLLVVLLLPGVDPVHGVLEEVLGRDHALLEGKEMVKLEGSRL